MVRDGEDEAENAEEAAGAETAGALSSDQEDHAGTEEIAAGSIQANLKKMFERVDENEESEPDIAMDGAAEPEEGV